MPRTTGELAESAESPARFSPKRCSKMRQAHRLTDPDQVYFDLGITRRSENLHGKLIQVAVEDSLLRRIRLAERKPGVIRLVLETKRSCAYSAMIASAPYRLIIKLHPF
jgi:AMIN domain